MKQCVQILALILCALIAGLAPATVPIVPIDEIKLEASHRRATRLITHFIANYHYKKAELNDALSQVILDRYLETLDPTKSYFVAADIAQFDEHAKRIDDYLRTSDLQPMFDIFVAFRGRVEGRVAQAIALLEKDFDFTRDESFMFDRKDAAWAADATELDELWRQRVKNDVLSLRLAGKEDDKAKETLRDRYAGLARSYAQLNDEDVFQMFINAYTTSIDPHTAYFSPRTSENFKIRMSLSLEGIGAVLQSDNEYTLVREVVPGGPADLSGKLHPDDRIVGIGQKAEGAVVDVIGWRLDDVVDLIRGPKGSTVRLEILPKGATPDGLHKTVALVRDTIKLEEQAAKQSVIEVPDAQGPMRIGVVDIPTFYMDFEARTRGEVDYRSTTRDVRKLLQELQTKHLDGLIVDLRGDGGGSLSEATDLTGLFIDTGPVVQVKNSQGRVQLERDTDRGVAYDGPLAVLVDRYSASASEIFAGAIQDYGRGIIVGEPTFGKGTVQNLVDLNRFDQTMKGQLGQLKATIAQFFRVEGSSTQHRGVVPDITFPTVEFIDEHGERSLDNALPWARIEPARFKRVHSTIGPLDLVIEQHRARIADDPAFQALLEQERALKEARDKHQVSLLESVRREEYAAQKRAQRHRENQIRLVRGLEPLPDEPADEPDATAEDEPEDAFADKDEEFDILLEETSRVLRDFVRAWEPASRLVEVGGNPLGGPIHPVPVAESARVD